MEPAPAYAGAGNFFYPQVPLEAGRFHEAVMQAA
jgi:hypothetical protein